ncbi:MAG: MFS transporter [Planctomycetota bacterium]|nr:MFS transporter [Planctomycetota bacterium]
MGGALGGILFGMLSDKIGRKKTLSLTIMMYSLFTFLSAFSFEWWHLAGFRFLVALGVGGEWAVAGSLVFEVFPQKARARVLGIFHASSVFGTYLAVTAGIWVIGNPAIIEWAADLGNPSLPWRIGFAIGAIPALLIIWIRLKVREPEGWAAEKAKADGTDGPRMGAIGDLFNRAHLRGTLVGVSLAALGMATFWGVHIYGKNVLRNAVEAEIIAQETPDGGSLTDEDRLEILETNKATIKNWEMRGMFLVTTGGGLGLVLFGPFCERVGRRPAFLMYHVGGVVSAVTLFQFVHDIEVLYVALPVFGFLTLGMHAGYAIYFPELYPTRLRGTGTGFCFNAGRILAIPVLLLSGWLQKNLMTLNNAASLLSLLYLAGIIALAFAPETRGRAEVE